MKTELEQLYAESARLLAESNRLKDLSQRLLAKAAYLEAELKAEPVVSFLDDAMFEQARHVGWCKDKLKCRA